MSLLRRMILVPPLLMFVGVVTLFTVNIVEPVLPVAKTLPNVQALGVDSQLDTVFTVFGYATAGVVLIISTWWITGDLRLDLFQGAR